MILEDEHRTRRLYRLPHEPIIVGARNDRPTDATAFALFCLGSV